MKLGRQEFENLALAQLDMLYRIARRLARDPAGAEDLVQETYLRALRAREDFDLQAYGIRPWLVRIMHNLYASRSQREKRQPRAVEDEQLDRAPAGPNLPPLSPGSFEAMDQHLVRAVDSLPEEYQTVLLLWALDDLSYKEIAQAVAVPIGTVMSRLHRARQRMADQLREYAKREGIIRE